MTGKRWLIAKWKSLQKLRDYAVRQQEIIEGKRESWLDPEVGRPNQLRYALQRLAPRNVRLYFPGKIEKIKYTSPDLTKTTNPVTAKRESYTKEELKESISSQIKSITKDQEIAQKIQSKTKDFEGRIDKKRAQEEMDRLYKEHAEEIEKIRKGNELPEDEMYRRTRDEAKKGKINYKTLTSDSKYRTYKAMKKERYKYAEYKDYAKRPDEYNT